MLRKPLHTYVSFHTIYRRSSTAQVTRLRSLTMRPVGLLAVLAVTVTVVIAGTPTAVHPDVNLDEPLEREEVINAVNNAKTTWVAGRNFKKSFTKRYLKNLMGVLMDFDEKPKHWSKHSADDNTDDDVDVGKIPAEFDAREHFDKCPVIKEVRDQGSCGSCWAVSAVSSFTDRKCIATNGEFNSSLSAENLLSCCCCCAVSCGHGCDGGFVPNAFGYLADNGVVTGGGFHSKEGCQPYLLEPCEHHVPGPRKSCDSLNVTTPTCSRECYNKKYKEHSYEEDLHKAEYSEVLYDPATVMIQREIIKHGPLVSAFVVYEDFLSYKSGVYQHTTGERVGGHAVKIIGWGVEENTPYWLVTNSWNTDWGYNGFFKIKRNSNECFFESLIAFVRT